MSSWIKRHVLLAFTKIKFEMQLCVELGAKKQKLL
jgi:hypothetical protein